MEESQSLHDRLIRLLQIYRKSIHRKSSNKDGITFRVPEDLKEEFNNLYRSIEEELLVNPGILIYIENKDDLNAIKIMIDLIWGALDYEELLEEATFGLGESSLAEYWDDLRGDYLSGLRQIKPSVISIDPGGTEFECYYSEAMRAWLFGLNTSALILCCSIIEEILYNEYAEKYRQGKVNGIETTTLEMNGNVPEVIPKMAKLINISENLGIINSAEKRKAHQIRELRNNAVHGLTIVNQNEAYQCIFDTKDLVEKILSRSDEPE